MEKKNGANGELRRETRALIRGQFDPSRVDLSRSPHVRCRVEITRQRIDVDWWHQSRDVFNTRVSIKGGEEGDVIGWRRYPCVRLRREPFCRREPYQSEIRREGWRNARPEIE